ncbi:DivIVA domain-containing protein [Micromonospora craniellae]|uniref:Cell wall synthesis protein Wag31 n=1 Tax=Micromonospora craniellae TaxID=2294034 RepID=A0A372FXU7_9ACTN|nr:DivIVA domain-containing protein [Micromonospora craniellae]QOC93307.1 DivIVA domain-containing protein [Micromonospora craniellae]RFS45356.1 DivIVA domain-containing protein [Micromonospora craniellae]
MIYVSGERLQSHHVRAADFGRRWRGLDPAQVYDYLDRVADELDRLHRQLVTANTEAERVRQALRQWQSRQTENRQVEHQRTENRQARHVHPVGERR